MMSSHSKTNSALWGQCIGDSIGRHLLNKDNASSIWLQYIHQQTLPFKRGKYSIYAEQALILVQQYQGTTFSNVEHFQQVLISRLRSKTSNTLLCRSIRNNTPFDTPDLETAARLGPLATTFTDHDKMLDWHYQLAQIMSTNPISIAGALLYSSACWHQAHSKDIFSLFSATSNWSGAQAIPSRIWWAYQQATWILNNGYGQQEMLAFVASFLGAEHKAMIPTSQQALSILPILWHNCMENSFITALTKGISIGGELELIGGITGCLTGIPNDIPDWLQHAFEKNKHLQHYPIPSNPVEKNEQFKLF